MSNERDRPFSVEAATYVAFSRYWEASSRISPVGKPRLQQRVLDYFRWLCRRIQPAVVLEIGAHEASFSRWASKALPRARVEAFEANPHVHAKYVREVTRAGVAYLNLAVAPMTGEIELNLPLEISGQPRALDSRMASIAVHRETGDSVTVTVPSVRLDDHVTLAEGERVVAWIDVEGANDAVLRSGPQVLDRLDAVHIEVEGEPTWEGQWLDTDVAHHLAGHGLVPVARDLQKPYQYNVVYVRSRLVRQPKVMRKAAEILLPD
ncbi:FkbM family methyltransferase [Nocardioides sp.]|uniref:FkbM family methyltransferase n=1 Tax=Nocardioides sp. TaxID=35761 RepID=UPI002ED10814